MRSYQRSVVFSSCLLGSLSSTPETCRFLPFFWCPLRSSWSFPSQRFGSILTPDINLLACNYTCRRKIYKCLINPRQIQQLLLPIKGRGKATHSAFLPDVPGLSSSTAANTKVWFRTSGLPSTRSHRRCSLLCFSWLLASSGSFKGTIPLKPLFVWIISNAPPWFIVWVISNAPPGSWSLFNLLPSNHVGLPSSIICLGLGFYQVLGIGSVLIFLSRQFSPNPWFFFC